MPQVEAFSSFDGGQTLSCSLRFLNVMTIVALLVHVAIFLFVANKDSSPWSGGGDAAIYKELARNISVGRGYTFAATPTACRAPFYPITLAGLMLIWPLKWRYSLRAIQLCITLCTSALCGTLAKKWGGQWRVGFLFGLLMPTLMFFQTEILTESVAAMLVALWWVYLSESFERHTRFASVLAGICAGVASLDRFNALPLILLGPLFIYVISRNLKRALLTFTIGCLIIAPWIAHNWRSFGHPVYSTLTGAGLVEGVLSPTGRGDASEIAATRNKLGWFNGDVETDSAPPELRDELALNAQATRIGLALWAAQGFKGILKLAIIKLGAFWFSTDQILATSTFSLKIRILRWSGVVVYLIFLTLAVAGWFYLRRTNSSVAWLILGCAVVITTLHLPVTMNTRLRVPFFDPLIASLAAVEASKLCSATGTRRGCRTGQDA